MADAEEDNVFEDEQIIIDYAEKEVLSDDDDDDLGSDDVGAAGLAKREKKEKKKRKFNEMKEKKISALSSQSSEPVVDVIGADSQFELYLQHKGPNVPMDFSEDNFLTLPSRSSTGEGNRFISTIDMSFASRADLLRAPDTAEEGCCSPLVLVICSGARRGCDVINALSQNFKCKIGKLFAKHFRIQDQIEILKSTHFPLAVGTPNRLHKLVEMGALSLSQTVLVIVDLCEDVKGFNVMNLCDTKGDFYNFMSTYCSPEKDHLKIACIKDNAMIKTNTGNTNNNGQTFGKKIKSQTNNKNRQGFQQKKKY
jgi:protein CMS1